MAIQIPRGDNLGNINPQVGRTRLQGGNGAVGRAIAGLGREVMGIAARLEYDKEQTNQVEMRNAVLEREKQVDSLRNDIDQRVKMGELDPEKAVEEYSQKISSLPKTQIDGLTRNQQETLSYYYNATDYRGQQQAFGIYQQGLVTKAQTAISEYARLANEDPNANIDSVLAGLDNEAMDTTFRTAFGQKAVEAKAGLKRDLLLSNLQNKSTIAADNGNYQALKQFKSDVMKADFYKGVLQNDDRVKLAHNANVGIDRIESKWKAAQTQAKLAVKEQYDNLTDNLYWQMSKEGKLFSELDQNQLALLKPKDYEYFKNYKTVKSDQFDILEDATYKINNQEDIDLNSPFYRKNLTSSTIDGLAKKKANLAANQEKANTLFSTVTLFNTRARASGVKQGTDDYVMLQNSTIQALDNREKEKGRKLTQEEQLQVIDNQFVQGYIKGGGWIGTDSSFRSSYFKAEDKSKFYVNRVKDIPESAKTELERRFKARGVTPTDEQLINSYSLYLQGGQ